MHHGNWCGPGWSNGKSVNSERGTAPAIDEFDETCRQHDFVYADRGNLISADYQFARDNLGTLSVQRNVAGAAVGIQGLARHAAIIMTKSVNRLRRSEPEQEPGVCVTIQPTPPKRPKGASGRPGRTASAVPARMATSGLARVSSVKAAPVAYSNTVQGYQLSSNAGVTTVRGREFASPGVSFSSATTQLTGAILHHPSYYATTALGNLARSFREYRWDYIKVNYLGVCSTATNGWTQIVTNRDAQDSAYKYATNGDLLQRSMSTQNAILGNCWENITHIVPTTKNWMLTQPFDGEDLRDHVAGETYIYQAAQITGTVGLVVIDYGISFRDLYYTLHTSIPFSNYQIQTLTDSSTTPQNSSIVQMNNSTITASSSGSVWRLIVMADQSAAGTGGTLSNIWKTYTDGNTTNTLPLVNGVTVYATVIATTMKLYPTFEAAKTASSNSFIAYGTTLSTASSVVCMAVRVSLGLADLTSQS